MTMGRAARYAVTMMNEKIFLSTLWTGAARAYQVDDQWIIEQILAGEKVTCLASDPMDPNIIYAGTNGNGVLRSTDQGQFWITAGMAGQIAKSLAVSPHHPGTIYAGTKPSCIFISSDFGEHWSELEGFRKVRGRWLWRSPAEPPDFRAYVQGLSISPIHPESKILILTMFDDDQSVFAAMRAGARGYILKWVNEI
jgi:hypothetical protein